VPESRLRINIPASVWVVRTILVTSLTASGAGGSDLRHRICPIAKIFGDYESMHRRLADVLGSRAQADAAYDTLMKEADTNGQPIDSVVDLFIAVCTASDECNP
jgi:hypothetical protein